MSDVVDLRSGQFIVFQGQQVHWSSI